MTHHGRRSLRSSLLGLAGSLELSSLLAVWPLDEGGPGPPEYRALARRGTLIGATLGVVVLVIVFLAAPSAAIRSTARRTKQQTAKSTDGWVGRNRPLRPPQFAFGGRLVATPTPRPEGFRPKGHRHGVVTAAVIKPSTSIGGCDLGAALASGGTQLTERGDRHAPIRRAMAGRIRHQAGGLAPRLGPARESEA